MNDNTNSFLLEKISENNIINNISSSSFIINLLIAIVLSLLVSYTYCKFGKNIGNRKDFSSNFPLLSMVTMFIITVVKSSLALSLGLVGALSIVRFRTAIKEPEELVFIFLSMAIGLGLGANQLTITSIAVIVICLFIAIRNKIKNQGQNKYLSLMISYPKSKDTNFDDVIELIKKYSHEVHLIRFRENNNLLESLLMVNVKSYSKMRDIQIQLSKGFPSLNFDFIDKSSL